MEDLAKYAWIDNYEVFENGCVTVVTGSTVAEVVAGFDLDPEQTTMATSREAAELQRPGAEVVVQVDQLGDAVVTFEPNGFAGSDHDRAVALSAGGVYISYYLGAMGPSELVYAEKGVFLRSFEPVSYDNDGELERALPVEEGLPFFEFEEDGVTAKAGRSCLMLIERVTRVQIGQGWLLDEPHPTYWRRDEPGWPEEPA